MNPNEESNTKTRSITATTMPVSPESYETIKRFCEDMDIPNIPERRNMFVEIMARTGLREAITPGEQMTFYADNMQFSIMNRIGDDGGNVLFLEFDSPAIERLFHEMQDQYKEQIVEIEDSPILGIVISNDFEDNNFDYDEADQKINHYLNDRLIFNEFSTRYELEDDYYGYILDGRDRAVD